MEEIVTYLLKSSGLLATFFLAYHFLLRKETFFTSNRWFLLSGLATSILLPLFFIKKIVYVESPKITLPMSPENNDLPIIIDKATPITTESIDWLQILFIVYGIVATILIIKVIIDLISLAKLLRKQTIQKQEDLSYININQDIAPFSFFNYIVFNSSLYSQEELESILLHEKIHSQEKHSIDVLVAKLFTIVFWFNPLIWLYQKAIIQNLEYIADSKAIQNIEDKKCYQMALLKVVSHQNCLPITNHFYQSLIKKRIVMLNKNQSNKRSIWKYTLILPIVIAFVFLFQIKVVAQEKETNRSIVDFTWTKNSSDQEFREDAKNATKIIKFDFAKIERNEKNEITSITISFKDNLGNENTSTFKNKNGINAIHFIRNIDENGKGEIGYLDSKDIQNTRVELVHKNNKTIEKNDSFIESITDDQIIFVNGKKSSKDALEAIDAKTIVKVEVLNSIEAKKRYNLDNNSKIIDIKTDLKNIQSNSLSNLNQPIITTDSILSEKVISEKNKNMLLIINGKEYFQKDLRGFTFKCDGGITHYFEEEAVKRFGQKAKDGVLIFNGITKLEKNSTSETIQERKIIIFSNDNGDDIVFIPSEKSLKLPGYPQARLNDGELVLIVNGVEKSNPLETLNQMNLQNVKSVRVYDESGKETPGTQIKKIVITTK